MPWKTTVPNSQESASRFSIIQKIIVAVIIAILVTGLSASVLGFHNISAIFTKQAGWHDQLKHYMDENQYNHLADALIKGQVYLDIPVPDALKQMENPYDFDARQALNPDGKHYIPWDYAYFNEHFYSYFGVAPAILTFIPYKLITGADLRTDLVVLLFCVLFTISSCLMIRQLQHCYSKNQSFSLFLLGYLAFWIGSGVLELIHYQRIYSVPIAAAIFFTTLGFAFWLKAKHIGLVNNSAPAKPYLLLGSVCLAMNIGCRPQFLLAALLAIPVFWTEIKENRYFFSKKGLAATISTILPFVVIAIPQLWYNFARFGSVFDFGANYNLTIMDMAHRAVGINLNKLGDILPLLIVPPQFVPDFPFLQTAQNVFGISGEPFYQGLLFTAPIVFLLFATPRIHKKLNHLHAFWLVTTSVVLGLIIISADVLIATVAPRYTADFAWLFLIAAILVFWTIYSNLSGKAKTRFFYGVAALVIVGAILQSISLFGIERYNSIQATNPEFYETIKTLFGG
jgi:hypothetical protein